jgi:hypothetical protein
MASCSIWLRNKGYEIKGAEAVSRSHNVLHDLDYYFAEDNRNHQACDIDRKHYERRSDPDCG